jgi:hypothetical protein
MVGGFPVALPRVLLTLELTRHQLLFQVLFWLLSLLDYMFCPLFGPYVENHDGRYVWQFMCG